MPVSAPTISVISVVLEDQCFPSVVVLFRYATR
jgi:hypothetical protein